MRILLIVLIVCLITGCKSGSDHPGDAGTVEDLNPAAEGFNVEASDPEAVEIADKVMAAMGGRKNWDNTRYICWTFFGRRELIWDKWEGNVRIESAGDSMIYLVNINTGEGNVYRKGEELTQPDSVRKYLDRGVSIWINDSYWLTMPFKLKDSGVTLKYMGEDSTDSGGPSQLIQLTFEEVGDTPQNRYLIWVDNYSDLVTQWAYYRNTDQDTANWHRPWDNYRKYGNILLSGDRTRGGPGDIMVLDSLSSEVFRSPDPVDLTAFRN